MKVKQGEYTIGVDIGGTNIKFGILDYKNNLVISQSISMNKDRDWKDVVKTIIDSIYDILISYNILPEKCVFLGMGIPGLIDRENGKVIYSPNLNWTDLAIIKEINKHINIPVAIDNDANCAVLGEYIKGCAIGKENVILITLGTGVGSGILINGKIFEGGGAGGSELGHTSLIYNGIKCSCGRLGCAEQYVSANALIAQCTKAMEENKQKSNQGTIMEQLLKDKGKIDAKIPFEAFLKKDDLATSVVEQYIDYLGAFIVNIINSFRPDVILLSGGICNQGEILTIPLNKYVKEHSYAKDKAKIPEVNRALLGNNAGIIGAGNLYIEQ